jgi:hypothetical protein
MNSDLFKLNLTDVAKGVIVAVLAAVLSGLYQALTNQAVIDPKQLLLMGVTAGIGYLIKNFLTDENNKLLGKV